jgi:hypothetical protein
MRLIGLAVALAVSLTLPTLAAAAQETAKKAHVGVLLLTGVNGIPGRTRSKDGVTAQPGGSRSVMAPGLTPRPPLRRGALPREFAEIRRRANTGWGDRPTGSARIEGRPRPFGLDEGRGKLPGSRHSAAVSGVSP